MKAVLIGLASFVGAWIVILAFAAFVTLHWPNPAEWGPIERALAAFVSLCIGLAGWWIAVTMEDCW